MRIQIFPCLLALATLLGCSTRPTASLQPFLTNRAAICLPTDDPSRPWILRYALTATTINSGQLFITVHARGEVDTSADLPKWNPQSTAAFYVKTGDKFRLLQRLTTDAYATSYFIQPRVIRATTKDGDPQQLIILTEVCYGTGGYTTQHIFRPLSGHEYAPDLQLEEVQFIPAWESYQFATNETLWKGESSRLTDDALSFNFLIWKYENQTQTAIAKVTGAYQLERQPNGHYQISAPAFHREPVKDEDWH